MSRDLGDFLADGGAVVGGGAALGATLGFIAGSVACEFRDDVDVDNWARGWGMVGGLIGLGVLLARV